MFDFIFSAGFGALANLIQVASACGIYWTVRELLRSRRHVAIIVRNSTTGDQKELARIPARFVSRAEVMGLVSQAAGAPRLDFSRFKFDYEFREEIVVELPEESYKLLR
ncbi:MAG: hypothetical protein AAB605_02490 [Patescibacteria group bacterium]